jgi:hypothetical protein
VGKPEGKSSLERPRHRREDIKVDVREKRWDGIDWIELAQDKKQWRAVVSMIMKLLDP